MQLVITSHVIINECVYLISNTHIHLIFDMVQEDAFINGDIDDITVHSHICMLQYISDSSWDHYHQDLVALSTLTYQSSLI